MKKHLTTALIYAAAGAAAGVFYREFTKAMGFTGVTALGKVHGHLLLLGMVMYLLVAIMGQLLPQQGQKTFRIAQPIYHAGLILAGMMMLVRGVLQVLATPLSAGLDAAVSGLSGLGHIGVGVGLILMLVAWIKAAPKGEKA